jgi:quercetin dioxygenase-like cupin family protein
MKPITFLISLIMLSTNVTAQLTEIPSGVYRVADMPVTKSTDREARKFMEGSTFELSFLEIHATTQYKNALPKPSHTQSDIEELIYVKEGKMKFTSGMQTQILGKGSILLIPPTQPQDGIQNVGEGPLTYYVIMFRSKAPMDLQRSVKAGGFLMLNADSLTYKPSPLGGGIKYIRRPTAMFNELEMHVTELKGKGPSHTPHTHIDTELTLVLEGQTEMVINGKTYHGSAGDIYLMNSNELHGISNPTDAPCKYLAIRWK